MTKSTLKTVWLAGGGLFATWMAVNPNPAATVASNLASTPHASAVAQVASGDLRVQQQRLRANATSVALKPSARNPFRFGKASTVPSARLAPVTPAPALVAAPPPVFQLSGIASDGARRTAIISGEGQVYLVKPGEAVGGRYHVVSVDSDAATLRDDSGTEIRLVLR